MQSPTVPTGDNRPAGAIVAQRDARSNGEDVAAVNADEVAQAGGRGIGPPGLLGEEPVAGSSGGISPVR